MDSSKHIKSDTQSQIYLLKILEIPGKSVTQKYIDVIKNRLDAMQLEYSIDIIIDDNLLESDQGQSIQLGGGDSTYPYSLFEAAIDNIVPSVNYNKSWIASKLEALDNEKTEQNSLFDKLFSYQPVNKIPDTEIVVANEQQGSVTEEPVTEDQDEVEEPVTEDQDEVEEPVTEESRYTMSEIPSNFTGILQLQVSIHNMQNANNLTLGIFELNNLISEQK
mgnify:CR=1 FL=1